MKLKISRHIFEKYSDIQTVGAVLLHEDGRTDRLT
jgi:hypothetical protein